MKKNKIAKCISNMQRTTRKKKALARKIYFEIIGMLKNIFKA